MEGESYFRVEAANKLVVRTTRDYWQKIITFKHPAMKTKEEQVKLALRAPDEIRQSKQNKKVLLYYRKTDDYHTCVVVRAINGEGFIITTYMTDKIKEGKTIWKK